MNARYIDSATDIGIWVDEQMGNSNPEEGDKEKLVSAIQDLNHPPYGQDWVEFFESLAGDLYGLIEHTPYPIVSIFDKGPWKITQHAEDGTLLPMPRVEHNGVEVIVEQMSVTHFPRTVVTLTINIEGEKNELNQEDEKVV